MYNCLQAIKQFSFVFPRQLTSLYENIAKYYGESTILSEVYATRSRGNQTFFIPYRDISFKSSYLYETFPVLTKKMLFTKETDTFGHIVVWIIYTSHKDHFTPQHTAFEQSAACLSVFLESLTGLIRFAILWHAGLTLEKKNSCMNMNYNYSTTIFRSIFDQNVKISGRKNIFTIFAYGIFKVKVKNCK